RFSHSKLFETILVSNTDITVDHLKYACYEKKITVIKLILKHRPHLKLDHQFINGYIKNCSSDFAKEILELIISDDYKLTDEIFIKSIENSIKLNEDVLKQIDVNKQIFKDKYMKFNFYDYDVTYTLDELHKIMEHCKNEKTIKKIVDFNKLQLN